MIIETLNVLFKRNEELTALMWKSFTFFLRNLVIIRHSLPACTSDLKRWNLVFYNCKIASLQPKTIVWFQWIVLKKITLMFGSMIQVLNWWLRGQRFHSKYPDISFEIMIFFYNQFCDIYFTRKQSILLTVCNLIC